MAALSIAKHALDAYVCPADKAIEIILVRKEEDLENDGKIFHPEFTHQHFGDNESIFGYRNLKVKLYHSAARLSTYLGMTFTDKVNPAKCDGAEADEVLKTVSSKLQPGFHTNLSDFVTSLAKDSTFEPYGEKIHTFSKSQDDGGPNRKFEVYAALTETPGFCDYHERLQTFLLWFVDAASFIDVDDDRWRFYLVFEKYRSDGADVYAIAGYATVYHYYAYPNKIRPRISQMLILPPFQSLGIGAELLNTIYRQYHKDKEVQDITVEDPSEGFVRLRDFVDSVNCAKLSSFQQNSLKKGFNDAMANEARDCLKINRRQARRIYEILRLHYTNTSDRGDYRSYRLDVKKRLNIPFQRQRSERQRLQQALRPDEYRATVQNLGADQIMEQLDEQYQELEREYRHVLNRFDRAESLSH